jgi:hypothetical protein
MNRGSVIFYALVRVVEAIFGLAVALLLMMLRLLIVVPARALLDPRTSGFTLVMWGVIGLVLLEALRSCL